MFVKVSLFLAIFAIATLPLAQSLKCYMCTDDQCKQPTSITCNAGFSLITTNVMKVFFEGVKEVVSNDYSCIITEYNSNGKSALNVRGCVMADSFDCGLKPRNQTWTVDACKVCKTDNCNNAAGSNAFSFVVLITVTVLAKIFLI